MKYDVARAERELLDNAVRMKRTAVGRPPRRAEPGVVVCHRYEPATVALIKALTRGSPRDLAERALDAVRMAKAGASDEQIARRVRSWLVSVDERRSV